MMAGKRRRIAGTDADVRFRFHGFGPAAILYPIVDSTNWLRIAALSTDADGGQTPEALARVLGMYAGASALLWLMICMFGTIAVLATGMPSGADPQSFIAWLASQQNGVADAASWLLLEL